MNIQKIITRPAETIIYWDDETLTTCKVDSGDSYDLVKGVLWAIAKKFVSIGQINYKIEEAKLEFEEYRKKIQT